MPPSYSKCMASILSFLAIESKFVILYVNSPESFTVQDFFIYVQEIRRHDFEQKKRRYVALKYSALKMMNGFLRQPNRSSKGCRDHDGRRKKNMREKGVLYEHSTNLKL